MFRSRNKVRVTLALLVLLGISFAALNQKFNFFSASNSTSPPTSSVSTSIVREHLTPTGVYAEANLENSDDISLPYTDEIEGNLVQRLDTVFTDFSKAVCPQEKQLKQILIDYSASFVNSIPVNGTATVDGVTCQYVISGKVPNIPPDYYKVQYTITINDNGLNRSYAYNAGANSEEGAQKTNVGEALNITNNITGKINRYFALFSDSDPIYKDYHEEPFKFSFDGKINITFNQDLNGFQDLSSNFRKSGTPLWIYGSQRSWQMTTSGVIDFNMDINFSTPEVSDSAVVSPTISFQNISVCSNGCDITYNEKQHYVGPIINGFIDDDRYKLSGTITSDVNHTETYSGTMSYDSNKKALAWNDDLIITKDDQRWWEHNLKHNDKETGALVSTWHWKKTIDSEATLKPTQNNYSAITDHVTQDFDLTKIIKKVCDCPNTEGCIVKDQIKTQKIAISKTEHTEKTDSSENILRSGTGSYSVNNPASCPVNYYEQPYTGTFSGEYIDGDDSRMKISQSSTQSYSGSPTNTELPAETMIDPMTKIDNIYLKTYSIDLRVPGGFNIENGDIAVMSTPKVKALPSNIVVFISYDPSDPSFSDGRDLAAVIKVLSQVKLLNPDVRISYIYTRSRNAMLAAIKNVPSGAWLINLGHGGPTGLVVGKNDGTAEHRVTYSELSTALYKNNIKLDLFAGDTCYSARAPLADVIIGSIGVGYLGGGQDIGSLFGVGGYSFTKSTADITSAILEVAQSAYIGGILIPKTIQPTNPIDTLNY